MTSTFPQMAHSWFAIPPRTAMLKSRSTGTGLIYTPVLADSEAGPDIAEFDVEEFQPATAEAFKDPNAFDFLSQHGQSNDAAANLAR